MWKLCTGLVLVLLFAGGCMQSRTAATTSGEILFSRDVLPLLQTRFIPLLTEDTGLSAESWSGLMAGSDQGEVLIPFDADRSLIVEVAVHAEGSNAPTEEEIGLIREWIDDGARNDGGEVAYADSEQLLYVCNQGSAVISVIDMESNLVVRTVDLQDLGYSANAKPHHIAVAPDGSYWFVSLIGENTVLKFNRDNEVIGKASFEVPGMLALAPDEQTLFVGRSMSAVNPPQRIGVIEVDDMELEEVDVFFPRPHALDISEDGRHLYVASLGVNQMASIDTETLDIEVSDIPGHHHHMPMQFEVAPDGKIMIVGGEMSGELLFYDLGDPMQPSVVKTIELGGSPWNPTYTPDGKYAYVPLKRGDAVAVVDMSTREAVASVTGRGISEPDGSTVRPDGRYVYVTNSNLNGGFKPRYDFGGAPVGTLVVIDTSTNEVVKVLEVESNPTGTGTRPPR